MRVFRRRRIYLRALFRQDRRVVQQRKAALEKKGRMEAALDALGESGLRVVAERANSMKVEAQSPRCRLCDRR